MQSILARALSPAGIVSRILLIGAICLLAPPLAAQNAPAGTAPAKSPVDDFAQQYKVFKDALADLPRKIDEANGQVQSNNDAASANGQLDSLRGIVSSVLGLVADNGPVASLGHAAVDHARGKLNDLRQDSRFTKEQKDRLVGEWQKVSKETELAVADLDTARKELVELLRVVQSNQDFLTELEALKQTSKNVDVIRNLTANLRDISQRLRDLIQNKMKIPGM